MTVAAVEKISISIPSDVIEYARKASGGNLSAYVTDVLRKAQLAAAFEALAGHDLLMPVGIGDLPG